MSFSILTWMSAFMPSRYQAGTGLVQGRRSRERTLSGMPAPSKFVIELHPAEIHNLLHNPAGPVARKMLEEAGRVVPRGARIRAPAARYISPGRPPPRSPHDSIGFTHAGDHAGPYSEIHA